MGACCSKTSTIASIPTPPKVKITPEKQPDKLKNDVVVSCSVLDQGAIKKEVFVVKHRKSHEIDRHPDQEIRKSIDRKKIPSSSPNSDGSQFSGAGNGAAVRTSSCTKEEVEAILIQCGRLSRSSSGVKPVGGETPTRGRRYSGSKRSFDFDTEVGSKNDDDDDVAAVDGDGHGRRHGGEPRVSSPSSRRRSRERDPQQQRSGNNGRRVSRSPNRRSESPNPSGAASVSSGGGGCNRPGKMVSVPATDKGSNAGGGEAVNGGVKSIQVKRNVGDTVVAVAGSRTAASPRSRSPARAIRVLNENPNQTQNQNQNQLTLSRSNSRKAEHSPYRRNPLAEIDTNAVGFENPKHNPMVGKTRSSRLSRDLDIDPETLLNPNVNQPSYASLLLEDIQNFHQKNPTATATTATSPPPFSLPACVSKACSILEAVAYLNSATNSTDPSLHKYVTVRRGGDVETEERESSGSNSFAGSRQMSWMSSSWDLNSGDSTDCWTSNSRSSGRERESEVERSGEYPRNGIGRNRVGVHSRSAYSLPNNA